MILSRHDSVCLLRLRKNSSQPASELYCCSTEILLAQISGPPKKQPGGLFTVRLASIVMLLFPGGVQCDCRLGALVGRACVLMDLLTADRQRSAIIDGSGDTDAACSACGRRHGAGRSPGQAAYEVAVCYPDGCAERIDVLTEQ